MGTYWRYVNYTRREFFCPLGLHSIGSKESAVLRCAPALAWLLMSEHVLGDGYRGRWRPTRDRGAEDVRITSDGERDFSFLDEEFLNITPGLLQSMRLQVPEIVEGWQPSCHDIQLVQRVRRTEDGVGFARANPMSASCKCGWRYEAFHDDDDSRESMLELAVSHHASGGDE